MIALWLALIRFLDSSWRIARDVIQVCDPCRFSILVVAAGGVGLLLNDQGSETVLILFDAPTATMPWEPPWVWFHLAVLFWAFQSWVWARTMLNRVHSLQRPPAGTRLRWLVDQMPRIIGIGTYVIAVLGLLLAPGIALGEIASGHWINLVTAIAIGCGFYWWAIRRHDLPTIPAAVARLALRLNLTRLHTMMVKRVQAVAAAQPPPAAAAAAAPQPWPPLRSCYPFSPRVMKLTLAICLGLAAWSIYDPVAAGRAIGLPSVAFLAFGIIVPIGSLLIYYGQKVGFPVVTTLLIAAFLFSFVNDNHDLRTLPPDDTVPSRPPFDAAAETWSKACLGEKPADRPASVVFVATAGGGLRAAYWTATVLGALHDAIPSFDKHLFAISGVSGGSLGATVYESLLDADDAHCGPNAATAHNDYRERGQKILSGDFLSPTVTAMLYGDLLQRFIPVPLIDDRAIALESAFETVNRKATGATAGSPSSAALNLSRLAEPFRDLWLAHDRKTPAARPSLLLNGTHQKTGKRIITSNIAIQPPLFPDAYDLLSIIGRDVRASTAVLNSARFPYVTPAGTLISGGNNVGHVVDGGYFENFGAETLAEAIEAFKAAAQKRRQAFEPIVVLISSDPDIAGPAIASCDSQDRPPTEIRGQRGGNEVWAPLDAAFATRGARGILASKKLAAAYCGDKNGKDKSDKSARRFFHFRMCIWEQGQRPPALGWVLSRASRELIGTDKGLLSHCGNDAQLAALKALLR